MRYKLSTLLFWCCFLGVLIAAVASSSENARLRRSVSELKSQLNQLQKEFGVLIPEVEDTFNVVEFPHPDQYTWQWRVSAPANTKLDVGIATEKITEAGLPKAGQPNSGTRKIRLPNPAHGVLVTATVQQKISGGCKITLQVGGSAFGRSVASGIENWIDDGGSTDVWGKNGIAKTKLGTPVVLLRHRKSEIVETWEAGHRVEIPENANGVLIWVVPR